MDLYATIITLALLGFGAWVLGGIIGHTALNLAGMPGAFIAWGVHDRIASGEATLAERARWMIGCVVAFLGHAALLALALEVLVSFAAMRIAIGCISWLVWPACFLACCFPVWALAGASEHEAVETGVTNPQVKAFSVAPITALMLFITFTVLTANGRPLWPAGPWRPAAAASASEEAYRGRLLAILEDMRHANEEEKGKEDEFNNNRAGDRVSQLKAFASLVRSRSVLFEPHRKELQTLKPSLRYQQFHAALLDMLKSQFEIETKAASYLDTGDTDKEEAYVGEKRLILVEAGKKVKSAAHSTGDSELERFKDFLWPGQG